MTNEQLVTLIQNGHPERISELWTRTERFIRQQANKWTTAAEFDDLCQQAYLILHESVADFDPGEGATFIHYLGQRLSWGWARWLEETGTAVRLPSYMIQKIRKYKRTVREYIAKYGCEPSECEIGRLMGEKASMVRVIQETALKSKMRSLNEEIRDGDGTELQDLLPDDRDEVESVIEAVQHEQLAAVIWPMVDSLEKSEGDVIRRRFQRNMTLDEVGKTMGVSLNRVRQIEAKAMRSLRHGENRRRLQPFADDLYSAAVRGTGVSRFRQTGTSATEREAMRNLERQRQMKYTDAEINAMMERAEKLLQECRRAREKLERDLPLIE